MNKVMIYPFSDEVSMFLDNNIKENFMITHLVSFKGSKYTGRTYIHEGRELEVIDEFHKNLNKVDIVWFVDSIEKESDNLKTIILERIEQCSREKKMIWYTRRKASKKEKQLVKTVRYDAKREVEKSFRYYKGMPMVNIETPIISVIGLLENSGKYGMQLYLKSYFEKHNKKIIVAGSRDYTIISGVYPFPQFMTSRMKESDKVVAFNNYIRCLELKEKPDVILIGVPGGTNTFSNEVYTDFGVMNYEINQAIVPDITILCTPCFLTDPQEVKGAINSIENRIGVAIDYIVMENKIICSNETERYKEIRFLTINEDEVIKQLKVYGTPNFFSALSQKKLVAKRIFEQLELYSEVHIV